MAELRPSMGSIRGAGLDLAVIGTGSVPSARAFQVEMGIPDVSVYVDELRRAYDAAGFHRGIWTLLRPRAVWNYVRAFFSGYRGGRLQGDALQQGGVLVVVPGGRILYRHASRSSGDHSGVDEILSSVRTASSAPVS